MIPTLLSLATRQVSLDDVLSIGLDNLPASDDFLRALATSITEEIVPYYEKKGWPLFRQDLLFILDMMGETLDYQEVSLYWNEHHQKYILMTSEVNDTAAGYFIYDTLDDVVGQILLTLIENHEVVQNADISSNVTLNSRQQEVYDFMAERHHDDVTILWDHLEIGGLVEITGGLDLFSLYPLYITTSAYLVLDADKLVIVGLFNDNVFDDIDPEFNRVTTPYVISFSRSDAKRILAILVYNPESYQLVTSV